MHARTPSVFLAMAYLACRTVSKWDVSILMGCGPGNELDDPHKVLKLSLTSSPSCPRYRKHRKAVLTNVHSSVAGIANT
jgi:hypothetical protein